MNDKNLHVTTPMFCSVKEKTFYFGIDGLFII